MDVKSKTEEYRAALERWATASSTRAERVAWYERIKATRLVTVCEQEKRPALTLAHAIVRCDDDVRDAHLEVRRANADVRDAYVILKRLEYERSLLVADARHRRSIAHETNQ